MDHCYCDRVYLGKFCHINQNVTLCSLTERDGIHKFGDTGNIDCPKVVRLLLWMTGKWCYCIKTGISNINVKPPKILLHALVYEQLILVLGFYR